jgi:hypothetical protein
MQAPGLFGSTVLEVAVGLICLYFLLSIVCSSAMEVVASVLQLRAKQLEKTLANLINDPELLSQVLNHPLVRSLGQRNSRLRGQARDAATLEGRPSYIPARLFSQVLLYVLANPAGAGDGEVTMNRVCATARALASAAATEAAYEAKRLTGTALLTLIQGAHGDLGVAVGALQDKAPARALDAVGEVAGRIQEPRIRAAALGLVADGRQGLDEATHDLGQLRARLESWFDEAMDRASGAYKRDTLRWMAAIAIAVTVLTGADSVRFVSRLYADPLVRTQLAAQASHQAGAPLLVQGGSAPLPTLGTAVEQLEPLETLFGYADYPSQGSGAAVPLWVLSRLGGELVTVFAILLGAPFWFDLLQKLVNLRAAGPAPAPEDSKGA